MAKILTFALLAAVASDFFTRNPNETEVYVTEDGQPFVMENRAALHATQNNLTYKKYTRGFDESQDPDTEVPVGSVVTPKQPDAIQSQDPEYRGTDKSESETAQETAETKAAEIDADENYESVAAIVAKIPELALVELNEYLTKENAKEQPRVTLVKALEIAIAKIESENNKTIQNPE